MDAQLEPTGTPITLDEVTIRTPGLRGHAREVWPSSVAGMRAETDWTAELAAALEHEGVAPQVLLELDQLVPEELPRAETRSLRHGEPTIELQVPAPSEGWGQFVLATDEAGVTTWEFATDTDASATTVRGSAGQRRYLVRGTVPPPKDAARDEPRVRGVAGAIGKKLLGVFVFPLLDPLLGRVGESFAERWETRSRPYRVRTYGLPDHRHEPQHLVEDRAAWERLAAGRSLLLVHGTFSRAHTSFAGLADDTLTELERRYHGRVFAFDHFTLSHDPRRNVEWLLEHIPAGIALDVDVLCHSRGGLVARTLAERSGELSVSARSVDVRRIIFVASPNSGTVLTDVEHMSTFVDTCTNLANFLPDNAVTTTLEALVTVAKHLAVGTLNGLEGLQSMRPDGPFLRWLNVDAANQTAYHALAGDFEPVQAGWRQWFQDQLMDRIFGKPNDLVVPTASVHEANGSSHFPLADPVVYDHADGISHSTFFSEKRTQQTLLGWLQG